jgi:hypothetical protein
MKRLLVCLALSALALTAGIFALAADKEKAEGSAIIHDVYFTLKDSTPKERQKLVDACKKYLTGHPGSTFFAVGTLARDLDRPVNDRDWDVSLHIVFKDRAAHDKYQDAERHLQFIKENKDGWKKVRVFDSVASPSDIK